MLPTKKEDFKKTLNYGLLLYAIFVGVGGTLMLTAIIFDDSPENQLSRAVGPLSILALVVYGSCAIALIIRTILKRRGWI